MAKADCLNPKNDFQTGYKFLYQVSPYAGRRPAQPRHSASPRSTVPACPLPVRQGIRNPAQASTSPAEDSGSRQGTRSPDRPARRHPARRSQDNPDYPSVRGTCRGAARASRFCLSLHPVSPRARIFNRKERHHPPASHPPTPKRPAEVAPQDTVDDRVRYPLLHRLTRPAPREAFGLRSTLELTPAAPRLPRSFHPRQHPSPLLPAARFRPLRPPASAPPPALFPVLRDAIQIQRQHARHTQTCVAQSALETSARRNKEHLSEGLLGAPRAIGNADWPTACPDLAAQDGAAP